MENDSLFIHLRNSCPCYVEGICNLNNKECEFDCVYAHIAIIFASLKFLDVAKDVYDKLKKEDKNGK